MQSTMFQEDAMSVTAATGCGRGVVVSRSVLGELLLLATSAGLLRETLDTRAGGVGAAGADRFRRGAGGTTVH